MPGNIPHAPPYVVASWPPPNYIDPIRRTWLPIHAIILHIFSSLLIFLRLALRMAKHGGGFGLDDASSFFTLQKS